MDAKQEDETFFEMLESAYNTIDNHIHLEEHTRLLSTPSPPSFNFDLPDVSELCDAGSALTPFEGQPSESHEGFGCAWCDIPNMPISPEQPAQGEETVAIPTFREIVARALQLSRNAMGLAVNTAVYRSSYSSSTLTIDPMARSQKQEPMDDGAADVTDPSAVDVEHVSQLIAADEGCKFADVEILLGCFQLINKIGKEMSAEEDCEGEP